LAASEPKPPMSAIKKGLCVVSASRINTDVEIAAVNVIENKKPTRKAAGIKNMLEKYETRTSATKDVWI